MKNQALARRLALKVMRLSPEKREELRIKSLETFRKLSEKAKKDKLS